MHAGLASLTEALLPLPQCSSYFFCISAAGMRRPHLHFICIFWVRSSWRDYGFFNFSCPNHKRQVLYVKLTCIPHGIPRALVKELAREDSAYQAHASSLSWKESNNTGIFGLVIATSTIQTVNCTRCKGRGWTPYHGKTDGTCRALQLNWYRLAPRDLANNSLIPSPACNLYISSKVNYYILELAKCISSVPAPPGLPKLTSVPYGVGMLYSLWIGPSKSEPEASKALNQAGSCLGGACAATIPFLPDLSCTTLAKLAVCLRLEGLHSPGRCYESWTLLYMHGGRTYLHASLQERTCALQFVCLFVCLLQDASGHSNILKAGKVRFQGCIRRTRAA